MKKVSRILLLAAFMSSLLFLSTNSMAAGKYKKYDDFESCPEGLFVDNEKFYLSDGCTVDGVADVWVENFNGSQQLKFSYNGVPDTSCWARFNTCPERIVGIKADVTVLSCAADQNCLARVAWHRGITDPPEQLYVWESIHVRPNPYGNNEGAISSSASLLDHTDNFTSLGDVYWARLNGPMPILGETFTVTADFSKPDQASLTVGEQGTVTYKTISKKDGLKGPVELFKAIGIRVYTNDPGDVTDGEFVAYFDNIAIKTKGACDKKKPFAKAIIPKKGLPLDACSLDIVFSESMDTCCMDLEADPLWGAVVIPAEPWSRDRKTFTFSSDCTSPLPPDTKLNFVVNPDGGMDPFRDLAGNPAKKAKLSTKTEK